MFSNLYVIPLGDQAGRIDEPSNAAQHGSCDIAAISGFSPIVGPTGPSVILNRLAHLCRVYCPEIQVLFAAVTPTMSVIPIDFDLAATVSESHVHARVRTVELTPEVTMSFLQEVRNLMVDSRRMRVMLEFELAHTLNETTAYEVMTRCFGVMSGARVAFVNTDARQHPSLSFCTQVSQEFGEDFGYFTDPRTAVEWLGES